MENKSTKFKRYIINVKRYRKILNRLNNDKNLTTKNILQKLEDLEKQECVHIVHWEAMDFTLIARQDSIFRGTLLHITAALGFKKIMRILIRIGADIEAKCFKGFTPLHYAVKHNQAAITEFLLTKIANIHAVSRKGCTPLHLAAAKGSPKIAKILLHSGAEINVRDDYQNTPLHFAVYAHVKENILKTVNILVHEKADVNAKDKQGNTILHRTIFKKDNTIVLEGLLTDYEDRHTKDEFEKIALLNREEYTHKVVQILLENGAVAYARNNSGDTILHYAILFSSLNVIRLLIRHGADVNARDSRSCSPLYCLQKRYLIKNDDKYEDEIYHIVYQLIRKGSDIDATDNGGIPTLEAIIRNESSLLAIIIIRFVLLQDRERIKPTYLDRYSYYSALWDVISDGIKNEFKAMSTVRSYKTFFDFVFNNNANKLALYVKNQTVLRLVKTERNSNLFPMHAYKILYQYNKGKKRLNLLNEAEKSIIKFHHASINSSKALPAEIARKIAFFLKNGEIRRLNMKWK